MDRQQQILLSATREAIRHAEFFVLRSDHEPAGIFIEVARRLIARADVEQWHSDVVGSWVLARFERLSQWVAPPPASDEFVRSRIRMFEHEALLRMVDEETMAHERRMAS